MLDPSQVSDWTTVPMTHRPFPKVWQLAGAGAGRVFIYIFSILLLLSREHSDHGDIALCSFLTSLSSLSSFGQEGRLQNRFYLLCTNHARVKHDSGGRNNLMQ